jgi:two-component system chemotaxis response regulator CheY
MSRLLIADDSKLMRSTIAEILKEAGYTVVAEASNGYDACIEYDRHLPDLAIIDINMPIVNGLDAMRSILSKHPGAKVIIVSSESCSVIICHCLAMGAKDYIIKPFSIQAFLDTINRVLQSNSTICKDRLEAIYANMHAQ